MRFSWAAGKLGWGLSFCPGTWVEVARGLETVGVLSYAKSQKDFATLPSLMFNIDEQWVPNLIELRWLAWCVSGMS